MANFTGLNKVIKNKLISAFPTTLSVGKTIAVAGITWEVEFELGKTIGKAIDLNDEGVYDNFEWFGNEGFFSQISEDFGATIDSFKSMMTDYENNPIIAGLTTLLTVLEATLLGPAGIVAMIALFWDDIKQKFKDGWNSIVEWWNSSALVKWFNNDVKPWFTKDKWIETMHGVKEAFETTWENAISSIKEIWNKFAGWLNDKLTWEIKPIKIAGKKIFDGATIDLGRIPTFATGGFPEDGLFMANYNELIGRFSNGQTAVANNGQIIAGIEGGVERAVARALAPYLADIDESSRITANKNFGITEKQMFNAVRSQHNKHLIQAGKNAFI